MPSKPFRHLFEINLHADSSLPGLITAGGIDEVLETGGNLPQQNCWHPVQLFLSALAAGYAGELRKAVQRSPAAIIRLDIDAFASLDHSNDRPFISAIHLYVVIYMNNCDDQANIHLLCQDTFNRSVVVAALKIPVYLHATIHQDDEEYKPPSCSELANDKAALAKAMNIASHLKIDLDRYSILEFLKGLLKEERYMKNKEPERIGKVVYASMKRRSNGHSSCVHCSVARELARKLSQSL